MHNLIRPCLALLILLSPALGQVDCDPAWLPTFGGPQGADDDVLASVVFDDGSGPALYIGGRFNVAGGAAAEGVARWDGQAWQPVGQISSGYVAALAVYDDGTGPALYAGGLVSGGILRWNGVDWVPVGGGLDDDVWALTVHDDGSGPALFAGGRFREVNQTGLDLFMVAKWDGSTWSRPGPLSAQPGGTPAVYALTEFDDGNGPVLYAGGSFGVIGGISAVGVARWDGSTWTSLGAGAGAVRSLQVFDDGNGPDLYVGGLFTEAGGIPASLIARWDGASWSSLGPGLNGAAGSTVQTMAVWDDGNGPALYAGGGISGSGSGSGSVAASHIARWDGVSWSGMGPGTNGFVETIAVFDSGQGEVLVAGGAFTQAGGQPASRLALWDGGSWSEVEGGNGVNGPVRTLAEFDDGSGNSLFVGGEFLAAGSTGVLNVARWDGADWFRLGEGLEGGPVDELVVLDDGSGPALYAGGSFDMTGSQVLNGAARWSGTAWLPLGGGVDGGIQVYEVFDDGSGPALYAGGSFSSAGGVAANNIAKWDGTSWSPLAGGVSSTVLTLEVFDDGNGDVLYAGGWFTSADGMPASYIARWDGTAWSVIPFGSNSVVRSLLTYDDGETTALYAGGSFGAIGGVAARRLASFDGVSWSALGEGVIGTVEELSVIDVGNGPFLYAAGILFDTDGVPVEGVIRWDEPLWLPLGSGMTEWVYALGSYTEPGLGTNLFAGGIGVAPDSGDSLLARWGGCATDSPGTSLCNGDGGDQMGCSDCPCTNNAMAGTTGGCLNSAGTSTRLWSEGTDSISTGNLRFEATGAPPGVSAILISGNALAPANPTNPCFGLNSGIQAVQLDGLRCVIQGVLRHGVRASDSNGNVGQVTGGWGGANNFFNFEAFSSGTTKYFQIVHRDDDSVLCMTGQGTSQAQEVLFTP